MYCSPAIDCGPLSAIANGAVSVSPDTKLGSSAKYTCDKGYTLNGYPVRKCLASGEWSSRKPSCRRELKTFICLHLCRKV